MLRARLHELGSAAADGDRSSFGYNRVRRRVFVTKESPGLARACGEALARRRGVGHLVQRLIGSHFRYIPDAEKPLWATLKPR
jgi:hypothetical protein